ncbi:hypothetical protein MTO96_003581 [Rhipicephalus appendiculatus]
MRRRKPTALKSPSCSTEFCKRYASLLNRAVNYQVEPCQNFYQHVCGLWDNTHGDKAFMEVQWRKFIDRSVTKLNDQKAPAGNTDIESKARLYLKTCMKLVNQSNIPNIKQVLAKGQITWPEKNPNPDFLRALFFMSRSVDMPVLLHFIFSPGGGLLTWNQRSDYMTRANILRNLEHTKEIRDHLSVSYEDFNGTVNQSRMDEIMDHMSGFLAFTDKMANSELTPVTFNDSTKFFEFTPTVPQERWRAILNQYLSKPIESYTGVTINGVDYFKAVFEMHKNGEDVMNDIVEALAVQNLVPFTSMEMIRSFHKGQGEESTSALMHTCFELLYPFFGYVVNHLLMHSLVTTELQARDLARRLRATFINSVTEQNQTLPIGNVSASRSHHTMEIVFGILDRSLPSQFPLSYQNYPDITEDPLINWVNLDIYYSNLSSEMKHTIIRYEEADYVTFMNFVMMLHYLMFPFAADDAHIGVFTGGIGLRLAATVFYQLVEDAR